MRGQGDAAAGHWFGDIQRRGTDRSVGSKHCGTGTRSNTHYSGETAFACTQDGPGHANNLVEFDGDSVCQSTSVKPKKLGRSVAPGLLTARSSLRIRAKAFCEGFSGRIRIRQVSWCQGHDRCGSILAALRNVP
jgi:hypothetical protein